MMYVKADDESIQPYGEEGNTNNLIKSMDTNKPIAANLIEKLSQRQIVVQGLSIYTQSIKHLNTSYLHSRKSTVVIDFNIKICYTSEKDYISELKVK